MPVRGKCIASQELRAGPGVLPTEVGTNRPTEADAQVLRQVRPTCGGIKSSSSGVMLLHGYAYKPSSIVVSGYRDDCYKVHDSCILASVLDKGKPTAR